MLNRPDSATQPSDAGRSHEASFSENIQIPMKIRAATVSPALAIVRSVIIVLFFN